MPTEDDLRDALQLFSDAAEPAQLEPKKNRPRRTVVLVAVAATVAAAIAIPLAVKGHNTPPPADTEGASLGTAATTSSSEALVSTSRWAIGRALEFDGFVLLRSRRLIPVI